MIPAQQQAADPLISPFDKAVYDSAYALSHRELDIARHFWDAGKAAQASDFSALAQITARQAIKEFLETPTAPFIPHVKDIPIKPTI